MSNNPFYGEIVANISSHLIKNPEILNELELLCERNQETDGSSVWTVCAHAAHIFEALQDLIDDQYMDWQIALDHYADELLDYMLMGKIPRTTDMLSMLSRCIQHAS